MADKDIRLEDSPLWYKDAIIYQVHVKSFYDSNNDGIGDFRGLVQKLDYLENIGITAVWLLPFYPSPRRDDGYDIADYYNIDPDYGTMRDFRAFLKKAHQRGIRVITELVVNHTSDQHAWFRRARQAKAGSTQRNFYVWSDTPDKYRDARIIFKDFETSNWSWDPVAQAYYWHRFYSHQPDLNFENPQVQREIIKVMDFWFGMGVDGLRLDAVPYLYEQEGTNCENLPPTHAFLKKLRSHVDEKYPNRMLLAEANQWPEDAVAYFGTGDECHMAFHFPIMPRMFMALWMEDRFPLIDILEQTPAIPETCQWGIFLRNHDELTLEMVTDEERDYMYRVYAEDRRARINLGIRRRLAPLMKNNRRKLELMNFLLCSLPGTPILYYGDEIGMGDNYYLGDRDGVRTPMQWSADRNAGFSKANPQKLYLPVNIDPEYHYEACNVEIYERNPSSFLYWMRRVIAMRKRFKAFGRGSVRFLLPDNPKILAFIRDYEEQTILVVVNLSRYTQAVELDLKEYAGFFPEEVFSGNRFPLIQETPYVLTPATNDYYWFVLKKDTGTFEDAQERTLSHFQLRKNWQEVFNEKNKDLLENRVLPDYLRICRWFGGKDATIRNVKILDSITIPHDNQTSYVLMTEVHYGSRTPDRYLLPVGFAEKEHSMTLQSDFPQAIIARLLIGENEGVLYDGIYGDGLRTALLALVAKKRRLKGMHGEIAAYPGKRFRGLVKGKTLPFPSQILKAEHSNTAVLYENTFFLKLYRRLSEGINPDAEIVEFLSEKMSFSHIPDFAGAIVYQRPGSDPVPLGLLQSLVPNQGDAWDFMEGAIEQYFEKVMSANDHTREAPHLPADIFSQESTTVPEILPELFGGFYSEMVGLLGRRTAQMHRALAGDPGSPDFAPEPFSKLYQRSLYQSMRNLVKRTFQKLQKSHNKVPAETQEDVSYVLKSEKEILARLDDIIEQKIDTLKIRIHGDYHLGQVLFLGNDFLIIDFEGEPAKPASERRLKRSPLRDVAGMLRSFHYAAYSAYFKHIDVCREDALILEPWVDVWHRYANSIFYKEYREALLDSPLLPPEKDDIRMLLNVFLIEKVVYELDYELNNRPGWISIPIKGMKEVMLAHAEK